MCKNCGDAKHKINTFNPFKAKYGGTEKEILEHEKKQLGKTTKMLSKMNVKYNPKHSERIKKALEKFKK